MHCFFGLITSSISSFLLEHVTMPLTRGVGCVLAFSPPVILDTGVLFFILAFLHFLY